MAKYGQKMTNFIENHVVVFLMIISQCEYIFYININNRSKPVPSPFFSNLKFQFILFNSPDIKIWKLQDFQGFWLFLAL